jgi:predicted nucleotide-binding protein (sugar kinase/HSP70/actin superfamily)
METKKKVSFPRYANYNCAMKYILENGLDVTCVLQPPLTQHTLEIGSKYSPDFVCTPFKTSLGSEIEALEAGADTLVMTYGLCKLGYYGELQEQILRDLGYQFEFVNMTE